MALVEELDKKVFVQLLDGCKFLGILRSIDVYGNLVLESTYERRVCGRLYHDKYCGLHIVRGENIVLMGQVDLDKEHPAELQAVAADVIDKALKDEQISDRMRGNILKQFDFLE
jgi:U6 snRNA-associated Sm-like protein LSm1